MNNYNRHDQPSRPSHSGDRDNYNQRGDYQGGGYQRREHHEGGNYNREDRYNSGNSYNRREGGYQPRDHHEGGGYQRREGGYQPRQGGYQPRDHHEGGGGYQRREGGYQPRRDHHEGGNYNREDRYNSGNSYNRREGGYQPREGGYQRREGGYQPREGGYQPRQGGYQSREGGGGGYQRREGGYQPREGGYQRREGGYQPREGGYQPRQGGYQSREGGGGGYQRREGGYQPREGGYQPRQGGYQSREGGGGGYQRREYGGGGGYHKPYGPPRGGGRPGGDRRPSYDRPRRNSPPISIPDSPFLLPEHPLTQDFQRAIGMAKGTITEVDPRKKRGMIEIDGFQYKFEDERKRDLQRKYPIQKFKDREIQFAFWPTYSQKAAQYRKIDEAPTIKIANLRRTLPQPNIVEIIGQVLMVEEELFVMSVFSASQRKKYMVTIMGKFTGEMGDFIQMLGQLKAGGIHYESHRVVAEAQQPQPPAAPTPTV